MGFVNLFWIVASVILGVALIISAGLLALFSVMFVAEDWREEHGKTEAHGQRGRTAC